MKAERNTLQKNIIAEELKHHYEHYTADEIYEMIHEKYPTISRATVYRNIKQMDAKKELIHMVIPQGADKYEYRRKDHYHIHCVSCGKVWDSKIPYMEHLEEMSQELDGDFEILGHSLLIEGMCSNCKNLIQK